jgi:pimeloyl-ACP methyl ester carboxylesterase
MASLFTASYRAGSGAPLVLLHGFTDTWRSWELVLPTLARHHDVLAPTLAGHTGGPAPGGAVTHALVADEVERAMDAAGFGTAHLVGNSFGGYVALELAARGRAESVVAFAPAGGWTPGDPAFDEVIRGFGPLQAQLRLAAPNAERIAASPEGRRRATQLIVSNSDHIPAELIAHQMVGVAACPAAPEMIDHALRAGYPLEVGRITCAVRIVWGTDDLLLPWPAAAVRYRELLPRADWVVLDGIGHCPQLDVPAEAAELIIGMTGGRAALS